MYTRITLKRNDFFSHHNGNAYESHENTAELNKLNICKNDITRFTERITKCTHTYIIHTFIRVITLALILPNLFHYLHANTFLKEDTELKDLIIRPFIIYMEICLFVYLLYNYLICYKIMRSRAQQIIDAENKNNGFFRFSLNKLTLALDIESIEGQELTVNVNESLNKDQEAVSDIYCIPDVFKSASLMDIKSYNYEKNFAVFDLSTKIIEHGIGLYQENIMKLVVVILLPLGIILASMKVLDLTVTYDRKIFMGVVFTALTVMIALISRFYTFIQKKVGEFAQANNFRLESKGIYADPHIMGQACYVFVYYPNYQLGRTDT
jgi:hypothetical protein